MDKNVYAYYNDIAARINQLKASGRPDSDPEILRRMALRNQKLLDQDALEYERQQQEIQNQLVQVKLWNDTRQTDYSIAKPYYKTSRSGSSGGSYNFANMFGGLEPQSVARTSYRDLIQSTYDLYDNIK